MTESYRTLIMLRVGVICIAGFLMARYITESRDLILYISLSLGVIALVSSCTQILIRPLARSIALILLLFAGSILLFMGEEERLFSREIVDIDGYHSVILTAQDYPRKYLTTRVKANIIAIDSISPHYHPSVQLSIKPDVTIHPGDTIIAQGYISTNTAAAEPYAFDYAKYLLDQGIGYQCYVPHKVAIRPINRYKGWDIMRFGWRSAAIEILRQNLSADNYALAASMILGYRNELDPELSDQFAKTGAIHILAVSGMHVGIVLLLIAWGIRSIPVVRHWKPLYRDIIAVPFLLLYVLITGSPPSVIRATALFFFWRLSNYRQRDVSPINIWASAGVFMLLVRPLYLWDVGFQLSFVAVLSIIVFMPIVSRFFYFKSKILKWLWSIIAVSIAAQILIFPLSLYYFHQFPLLFPVSSVWAILLALFIIPAGFALLALNNTALGSYLAHLLEFFCDALKKGIIWMSNWSHTTIQNVWIHQWELFLLYGGLIALVIFIVNRQVAYLLASLTFCIVLLTANTLWVYRTRQQFLTYGYAGRCAATELFIGNRVYVNDTTDCTPASQTYTRMAYGITSIRSTSQLCELIK